MTTGPEHFPPGTILASMLIDIYASKERDDVWIMHSEPFEEELQYLEINPAAKSLDFIFKDGTKNLGAPLRDELVKAFQKVGKIMLYQIDMATKKPQSATEVDVKIKQDTTEQGEETETDLSDAFGEET